MKTIIGLGEALWDCLPEGRKLGGAPANFAYHAQANGCHGVVVSAVGDDELGDEIVEQLNEKNLELAIARTEQPTGTVRVTLSGNGIPSYDICRGVAWDNIPWNSYLQQLAEKCDAVCFGSLAQRSDVSRDTIQKFLLATPKDALRIFDINLRQDFYTAEIIDQSMKACNILKINDEEWEIVRPMFGIAGTPETTEGIEELVKRYDLKLLILTCGTNGSYVFTAEGEKYFQPTPLVTVADTVGAGDSFTGTFVASIAKGMPVKDAHEKAVKVSAFVCTQHGPMPDYSLMK